jgi:hypothetical protein
MVMTVIAQRLLWTNVLPVNMGFHIVLLQQLVAHVQLHKRSVSLKKNVRVMAIALDKNLY